MPELPEVETVRRGLHALVKSYTISDARQLHPRALKPESIAPLESLNGAKKIAGTTCHNGSVIPATKALWVACPAFGNGTFE